MNLSERNKYLGGTDCASVLGMSRWGSPLSVWAYKTLQVEPPQLDSEAASLGIELEDYVARRFMKKTGKKVQRRKETVYHPKHPFLAANLDRIVVGEDAILECKTCSVFKAKEWDGDEIPREYILQCLHYLMVTGKKKAYIAVLIGNQDFKWKEILRDEKVLMEIEKKEVAFWKEFVETKMMPTMITKNDNETLLGLFPQAEVFDEKILTDDTNKICESLEGLKADARNLEGQIDQQENELKALLGEFEAGATETWRVAWKNIPASKFTVEKKQSRRFTIKKLRVEVTNGNSK